MNAICDLYKRAHKVTAKLVYTDDQFAIDVEAKTIRHKPNLRFVHPYQGVVGAYAYAVDVSGVIVAMVYADKKDLDTEAKDKPYWSQDPKVCARNHVVSLLQTTMKEQGIQR